VELAQAWESLRRQVEDRPAGLPVVARVRRERLDLFCRICAAHLAGPVDEAGGEGADGEWVVVPLRFPGVPAARPLLSFGADVEVVSPEEVRADLASVAAEVVAAYR